MLFEYRVSVCLSSNTCVRGRRSTYIVNVYVPWHSVGQNRKRECRLFRELVTKRGEQGVTEGAKGGIVGAKLKALPRWTRSFIQIPVVKWRVG